MGEILPSKNNSSRYCQKLSSSCVCLCPLLVNPTNSSCPALGSMRAREPGLQAPSNLAGSKIKNTHFSPLIISFSEISNIGKRTHHVSCTFSEGMAIKPMNLKLVAKYSLLQALSKHENRLAGSGGDSRTGADTVKNCLQFVSKSQAEAGAGLLMCSIFSITKRLGSLLSLLVIPKPNFWLMWIAALLSFLT